MRQALEFARTQAGFEEQGSLCPQRGSSSSNNNNNKPVQSNPPETPSMTKQTEKEQVATPSHYALLTARAAAQQALRRLEFEERSREPPTPSDYETDVDRLFVRPQAQAVSPHLAARQAALQYIQRLQHAGRLLSRDYIPHALRGEPGIMRRVDDDAGDDFDL